MSIGMVVSNAWSGVAALNCCNRLYENVDAVAVMADLKLLIFSFCLVVLFDGCLTINVRRCDVNK